MEPIRLATSEEARAFHDRGGEVIPGSLVVVFTHPEGQEDYAVIRPVIEVDVEFSSTSTTRRRALFIHELETFLRLSGKSLYYFEVPSSDAEWMKNVESWGAERVFKDKSPMYRYRKVL